MKVFATIRRQECPFKVTLKKHFSIFSIKMKHSDFLKIATAEHFLIF